MIEIEKLTFAYKSKNNLFKDLNLQVQPGQIIGLLGKNGAGKSTLLKIMCGLLNPQKGMVRTYNFTPSDRKPDFLQDTFFVPETFFMTSGPIKSYVKATSDLYPKFDIQKLEKLSNDFEIDLNRKLKEMSHGQQKKFMIAFALATNCSLILLDEPTNGLDIPSKSAFRKIVASALSDEQLVIISTHQVKDVENLLDRIVLIDQGQIVLDDHVYDIGERYAFHTVASVNETHLYNELAPAGFKVIEKNKEMNTEIDLELLFNAVTSGVKLKEQ